MQYLSKVGLSRIGYNALPVLPQSHPAEEQKQYSASSVEDTFRTCGLKAEGVRNSSYSNKERKFRDILVGDFSESGLSGMVHNVTMLAEVCGSMMLHILSTACDRLISWRVGEAAVLKNMHSIASRMSVDLRSDTITQPTKRMREAMASAIVGDDVFGEDPTVNALQDKCAAMFGKEAALFVPTGTMGNLISVMVHCQGRGLEAIIGDKSHIYLYEQGGIAELAGVNPRAIQNKPDGTFDLNDLQACIRPHDDPHQPRTKLICLENTQNVCGGKTLPLDFMKKVKKFAEEKNLPVHLDGARVLNAAVSLNVEVSEITRYCDSLTMCFSKGLSSPVGSILAGKKEFIEMAVRMRKILGGGLRQCGILAAAALVSLDEIYPKLHIDHERAKRIAEAIMSCNPHSAVNVNVEDVHSNIVMIEMKKDDLIADSFCNRLMEVTPEEKEVLGEEIEVRMFAFTDKIARFVTHNNLMEIDIERAIKKMCFVVQEFSK